MGTNYYQDRRVKGKGFREKQNMTERFELIYGTVHCRGKTIYSAGFVDTEEEARSWIKGHQNGQGRPLKIPSEDPVRFCKADFCPFKSQKPWVSFR
jgi:hypothetical protein